MEHSDRLVVMPAGVSADTMTTKPITNGTHAVTSASRFVQLAQPLSRNRRPEIPLHSGSKCKGITNSQTGSKRVQLGSWAAGTSSAPFRSTKTRLSKFEPDCLCPMCLMFSAQSASHDILSIDLVLCTLAM